ncbi:MAG: hypothetical protein LBS14_00095 [Holosporaceae bacterium]|nr:hypothetical protein [Holosporaceae bacterium]
MKKSVCAALLLGLAFGGSTAQESDTAEVGENRGAQEGILNVSDINSGKGGANKEEGAEDMVTEKSSEDFQQLAEPERRVTGAYYGSGVTLERITHNIQVEKYALQGLRAVKVEEIGVESTRSTFAMSLLAGFGTAVYKDYYTGIETEFFWRRAGSSKFNEKGDVGVRHPATQGFGMDVRFGKQFPNRGLLVYTTVGFVRVLGRAMFHTYNAEGSFGSFFPALGGGVEYKINHLWNVRAYAKIALTNKDDNKLMKRLPYKYDGKSEYLSMGVSVTRSILAGF